ncbi:hypothetical protein MRX96_020805 [Rhipicephalus microplus]
MAGPRTAIAEAATQLNCVESWRRHCRHLASFAFHHGFGRRLQTASSRLKAIQSSATELWMARRLALLRVAHNCSCLRSGTRHPGFILDTTADALALLNTCCKKSPSAGVTLSRRNITQLTVEQGQLLG